MLSLGRSKVLAALGLILTLTLATVALVTQTHEAQASSGVIAPWSDSLAEYGMPTAPTAWNPSNFDVAIHTRGMQSDSGNEPHQADHGADCGAPPATHLVRGWQDAVYVCHGHVMTAIADSGYGEVALTPDHMADWSAGPVTIGFSVSTARTTSRDWITVDISPFAEQLSLPFDFGAVDLTGMPAHYVELKAGMGDNGQTQWQLAREQAGNDFGAGEANEWPYFEQQTGITPSAVTRTPFELTISASGYTFRVAPSSAVGAGKTLLSGNWSKPLTFTQGVVQFVHHSYNPNKCDVTALKCAADTWHWSNFSISSAVPYTLLRPVERQPVTEPSGQITFAQPAPSGSYLKFQAIGSVQVSYDGGKTFSAAQKPPMDASLVHEEHFTSYLTPVPAGTRDVQVKLGGGWFGPAMARDFSIVSLTASGSPPATQPPGPQPTPTQTSGPGPIPLNNTPCMVSINGAMQNGTCNGTFSPSK